MTDNILKRHVECTCDEYVEQVAGKQRKPFLGAFKTCFSTVVLGKSTLVKEMSSFIRTSETPLDDPKAVFSHAVRAAQAYCDRWQMELPLWDERE